MCEEAEDNVSSFRTGIDNRIDMRFFHNPSLLESQKWYRNYCPLFRTHVLWIPVVLCYQLCRFSFCVHYLHGIGNCVRSVRSFYWHRANQLFIYLFIYTGKIDRRFHQSLVELQYQWDKLSAGASVVKETLFVILTSIMARAFTTYIRWNVYFSMSNRVTFVLFDYVTKSTL